MIFSRTLCSSLLFLLLLLVALSDAGSRSNKCLAQTTTTTTTVAATTAPSLSLSDITVAPSRSEAFTGDAALRGAAVTARITLEQDATLAISGVLGAHSLHLIVTFYPGSKLVVRGNSFTSARGLRISAYDPSSCSSTYTTAAPQQQQPDSAIGVAIEIVDNVVGPNHDVVPLSTAMAPLLPQAGILLTPVLVCGSNKNALLSLTVARNSITCNEPDDAQSEWAAYFKDVATANRAVVVWSAIQLFSPADVQPASLLADTSAVANQLAFVHSLLVEENVIEASWNEHPTSDNTWRLVLHGVLVAGTYDPALLRDTAPELADVVLGASAFLTPMKIGGGGSSSTTLVALPRFLLASPTRLTALLSAAQKPFAPRAFRIARNAFRRLRALTVAAIAVGPLGAFSPDEELLINEQRPANFSVSVFSPAFVTPAPAVAASDVDAISGGGGGIVLEFTANTVRNLTGALNMVVAHISGAASPFPRSKIVFAHNDMNIMCYESKREQHPIAGLFVGDLNATRLRFDPAATEEVGATTLEVLPGGWARHDLEVVAHSNRLVADTLSCWRSQAVGVAHVQLRHLALLNATANHARFTTVNDEGVFPAVSVYATEWADRVLSSNNNVSCTVSLERRSACRVLNVVFLLRSNSYVVSHRDTFFADRGFSASALAITGGRHEVALAQFLRWTTTAIMRIAIVGVADFAWLPNDDAQTMFICKQLTVRDSHLFATTPEFGPDGVAIGGVHFDNTFKIASTIFSPVDHMLLSNVTSLCETFRKNYIVSGTNFLTVRITNKCNITVIRGWSAALILTELDVKRYAPADARVPGGGVLPSIWRTVEYAVEHSTYIAKSAQLNQLLSMSWNEKASKQDEPQPVFVGLYPTNLRLTFISAHVELDWWPTSGGRLVQLPTTVIQMVNTKFSQLFIEGTRFVSRSGVLITGPNSVVANISSGRRCSYLNGTRIQPRLLQQLLEPPVSFGAAALGISLTFPNLKYGRIVGDARVLACDNTETRTLPPTRSRPETETRTGRETVSRPATRSPSPSASPVPLPPFGQLPAKEQNTASALSSLASAAAVFAGPTVALDAGVALNLLAIVSRCQAYAQARATISAEDAHAQRQLEEVYAQQYLDRTLQFPESLLGLSFAGDSVVVNADGSSASASGRAMNVRGAITGGVLLLVIVFLLSVTFGFVAARAHNRGVARDAFLRRWQQQQQKRQRQHEQKKTKQQRRRLPQSRNAAADAFFGSDGDDGNDEHVEDEETAEKRKASEMQRAVAAAPRPSLRQTLGFSRLPYAMALAVAVQLSTWASNAASFLVAPSFVRGVSATDRALLGGLPLLLWLSLSAGFAYFLQARALTRDYPGGPAESKETRRAAKKRLKKEKKQQQKSGGCCASCAGPMQRADAFQTESIVLWSALDVADDDDANDTGKTKKSKSDAENKKTTLRHSLLRRLRDESSLLRWFVVPAAVWSQGDLQRSVVNGAPGSFLAACGSLVNKYHGPSSFALPPSSSSNSSKKQFAPNAGDETKSGSATATATATTTSCWDSLEFYRSRISPFAVFISSTFVVASGIGQAVAALHPRRCTDVLIGLACSQFVALLFAAVLRPFLLAPVNALVAFSSVLMLVAIIFSVVSLNASGGSGSGGGGSDSSPPALDTARMLLQVSVACALVKFALNVVSRMVFVVGLRVYVPATAAERVVLDRAERRRRAALREKDKAHEASVADITAAIEELTLRRQTRRRSPSPMQKQSSRGRNNINSNNNNNSNSISGSFALEMKLLSPSQRGSGGGAPPAAAATASFRTPPPSPFLLPAAAQRGGASNDDNDSDSLDLLFPRRPMPPSPLGAVAAAAAADSGRARTLSPGSRNVSFQRPRAPSKMMAGL